MEELIRIYLQELLSETYSSPIQQPLLLIKQLPVATPANRAKEVVELAKSMSPTAAPADKFELVPP